MGSAVLMNVLSALSWYTLPGFAGDSAAESAAWSPTSALRRELAGQGTQVTALRAGLVDTDMVARLDVEKVDPAGVAARALDGVEAGADEMLADDTQPVVAGRPGRRGRGAVPARR